MLPKKYISTLKQTLYFEKDRISPTEYNFLRTSIYITSRLMDLVINNNVRTRGWWSDWGKCTSGILGGVLGGGLTGAAAC